MLFHLESEVILSCPMTIMHSINLQVSVAVKDHFSSYNTHKARCS